MFKKSAHILVADSNSETRKQCAEVETEKGRCEQQKYGDGADYKSNYNDESRREESEYSQACRHGCTYDSCKHCEQQDHTHPDCKYAYRMGQSRFEMSVTYSNCCYLCPDSQETYLSKEDLLSHAAKVHAQLIDHQGIYKCPDCDKTEKLHSPSLNKNEMFKLLAERIVSHLDFAHGKAFSAQPMVKIDKRTMFCDCVLCDDSNTKYLSIEEIIQHIRQVHMITHDDGHVIPCPHCSETFDRIDQDAQSFFDHLHFSHNMMFQPSQPLETNEESGHIETGTENEDLTQEKGTTFLKCFLCNSTNNGSRQWSSKPALIKHIKSQHMKVGVAKIGCKQCNTIVVGTDSSNKSKEIVVQEIINHMEKEHNVLVMESENADMIRSTDEQHAVISTWCFVCETKVQGIRSNKSEREVLIHHIRAKHIQRNEDESSMEMECPKCNRSLHKRGLNSRASDQCAKMFLGHCERDHCGELLGFLPGMSENGSDDVLEDNLRTSENEAMRFYNQCLHCKNSNDHYNRKELLVSHIKQNHVVSLPSGESLTCEYCPMLFNANTRKGNMDKMVDYYMNHLAKEHELKFNENASVTVEEIEAQVGNKENTYLDDFNDEIFHAKSDIEGKDDKKTPRKKRSLIKKKKVLKNGGIDLPTFADCKNGCNISWLCVHCIENQVTFDNKNSLENHLLSHIDTDTLMCPLCRWKHTVYEMKSKKRLALAQHLLQHQILLHGLVWATTECMTQVEYSENSLELKRLLENVTVGYNVNAGVDWETGDALDDSEERMASTEVNRIAMQITDIPVEIEGSVIGVISLNDVAMPTVKSEDVNTVQDVITLNKCNAQTEEITVQTKQAEDIPDIAMATGDVADATDQSGILNTEDVMTGEQSESLRSKSSMVTEQVGVVSMDIIMAAEQGGPAARQGAVETEQDGALSRQVAMATEQDENASTQVDMETKQYVTLVAVSEDGAMTTEETDNTVTTIVFKQTEDAHDEIDGGEDSLMMVEEADMDSPFAAMNYTFCKYKTGNDQQVF